MRGNIDFIVRTTLTRFNIPFKINYHENAPTKIKKIYLDCKDYTLSQEAIKEIRAIAGLTKMTEIAVIIGVCETYL